MSYDLVIKNGALVTPEATIQANVGVKDGRIAAIASEELSGRRVIDAAGLYVLPGLIDGHVHFRDPGLTYKEDLATGSQAAAAGGICTFIDMPNTKPPLSTVEAFQEKKSLGESKACVDFGVVAVVVQDNVDLIPELATTGIVGYKVFMGETVGAIPAPDDGAMLEAFGLISKTGLRVGLHAENNQIMQHLIKRFKAQGRTDALAHLDSRPEVAEADAIQKAILFAEYTGAKVHIYHMSSKKGAELVGQAKKAGIDVTAETGPHYLLMDGPTDMPKLKSMLKMNPPVRAREHGVALFQGLLDGSVDMIATDHSPHTQEEKIKDNIWEAIPGFCGVETSVPLMLTQVNAGRMTLNQYVKVASENPARVWGMYPKKGRLAVGSDADFTLVDMGKEGVIRSERLHSKSKVSPFDGYKVKGMPVYTIVRGNVVMKDGEVNSTPIGKLVSPQAR